MRIVKFTAGSLLKTAAGVKPGCVTSQIEFDLVLFSVERNMHRRRGLYKKKMPNKRIALKQSDHLSLHTASPR